MESVGDSRWKVAQTAEAKYWQFARQDEVEMFRILHEKAACIGWVSQSVPELLAVPGSWIEIGIGPLGIGCVHLLPSEQRQLIGIDPLPLMSIAGTLSPALIGLAQGCQSTGYRHLTGKGEELELPNETAALAVCYNVLDHCDDPRRVIQEAARVLRVGGHFVLACDVYSLAGRIKYRLRSRFAAIIGRNLVSISDLAHPHQFIASDLEREVEFAGFRIVRSNKRKFESLRRLWSHSHRLVLIGKRLDR